MRVLSVLKLLLSPQYHVQVGVNDPDLLAGPSLSLSCNWQLYVLSVVVETLGGDWVSHSW